MRYVAIRLGYSCLVPCRSLSLVPWCKSSVAEYQVRVSQGLALSELTVTMEPAGAANGEELARRLERAFEASLALRVPVTLAAPGSLPRFESKARRWVRG